MLRTMMRMGLWVFTCALIFGQATQSLTFEVASVKPSAPVPRAEEFTLDQLAAVQGPGCGRHSDHSGWEKHQVKSAGDAVDEANASIG